MKRRIVIMTTTTQESARGSALILAAATLPSAEILDGLERYAKTGAPAWFGDLLKFNGKTGEYTAGSQGLPIDKGRVLVAVVNETIAGHVLWKDGELADQSWLPVAQFDPREHRATLGDQDKALWPRNEDGDPQDPWKEAVMLPMVDPNTRAEFTFSSSSFGGVRACKRLVDAYRKQIAAAPETTKGCLPVIALGVSSYKHDDKKRGTIFNPVFEGLDWIRASDLLLPPDPGEKQEPPPDAGEVPLKKKQA
jgi:hypothetical protein